jgi:CBS domain-containing protein
MIVKTLASSIRTRFRAIGPAQSIRLAAAAFSDKGIGLLVVCDSDGHMLGVVSKSDLVRHLASAGSAEAPISRVMTEAVATASTEADLQATWQFMMLRRLQNLPVVTAEHRPIGTLDIRDALQALLKAEQQQEEQLVHYISGVGYR